MHIRYLLNRIKLFRTTNYSTTHRAYLYTNSNCAKRHLRISYCITPNYSVSVDQLCRFQRVVFLCGSALQLKKGQKLSMTASVKLLKSHSSQFVTAKFCTKIMLKRCSIIKQVELRQQSTAILSFRVAKQKLVDLV